MWLDPPKELASQSKTIGMFIIMKNLLLVQTYIKLIYHTAVMIYLSMTINYYLKFFIAMILFIEIAGLTAISMLRSVSSFTIISIRLSRMSFV